jgi:ABC-type Fe3+ transport system substrate-binding protein
MLAACGAPAESRPAGGAQGAPQGAAPAEPATDWDQIVAQANREGRVAVIGPTNNDLPTILTENFTRRYPQITVEYTSAPGSVATPKLLMEHASGRLMTDLLLKGIDSAFTLGDAGVIADLQPYLAGPDIEPAKWLNGKLNFVDNAGRQILGFASYVKLGWVYSREQVNPQEFTSWSDLLDPKWRGKIVMSAPTASGSGASIANYWYATPGLGKAFIERFFKEQDVMLLRNDQQILNSVAHGRHAIAIGLGDPSVVEAIEKKGIPIGVVDARTLRERPYTTAGLSALTVMDRAPHPNATRVYLNWFLSQEGQTLFSKASVMPSNRQDVPQDHVFDYLVQKPGVEYYRQDTEDAYRAQDEAADYIKGLLVSLGKAS